MFPVHLLCATRSFRWRRRMLLCSRGPMWIYTLHLTLLQNISLKYVCSKSNNLRFAFMKCLHGPWEPFELLLLWRQNQVYWQIPLVKTAHLSCLLRPPLCREEVFRVSWCLQRSAVVSKTWALNWSRKWMPCLAGKSLKMARMLPSGVSSLNGV